jgi:hypothetical protein
MTTNPALSALAPLAGGWRMELHHASFLPDPDARISGRVAIDWIEDGCALRIRQGDAEHPPMAVWIVGRDDVESAYTVLYGDDRGISRIYRMSFEDGRWQMWRDTPEFTQRFDARVDADGSAIRGHWEKSTDQGATWEHDFNLDYIRQA